MAGALSIVIPTLDEEARIAPSLESALAVADEVVVSDGGSSDGTVSIAERLGATVVTGPPGRGGQLHLGADAARGEALVFLHADTRLPEGARRAIERALDDGHVGGGFAVSFDVAGPALRFGERFINLRTRLTRSPLGDQAQFASRRAYEAVGGFRDWPILEDLDFIRRLRRHGKLALIPDPVTTSSRRFRNGGWPRTVATNWLIWALWACGVPPRRLVRLYRHVR